MAGRFFLWAYSNSANFQISRSRGLLGFPEGGDHSWEKALTLWPRDIVLIRNSNVKEYLQFYGCCIIRGFPYCDAKELVWADEKLAGKIIYPYRVAVDFNSVLIKNLQRIDWGDILKLRWRNQRGSLLDKKGLLVKFSKANFLEGIEAEQLANLLSVVEI